jgi:hypothetical protein
VRGRDQLFVGLGYLGNEIENFRSWRSKRHEFILSIDGPAGRILRKLDL